MQSSDGSVPNATPTIGNKMKPKSAVMMTTTTVVGRSGALSVAFAILMSDGLGGVVSAAHKTCRRF